MTEIIAVPRTRPRPSRASLAIRALGGPALVGVLVGAVATALAPVAVTEPRSGAAG
jgi:hypothetical protein